MGCKTITVFSNKGGVGRTFITVNLGTALALAGHKVLLIDLDFHAGQDMARMLNLSPRSSIADLFAPLEKADNPRIITENTSKHACGLEFLPAVKTHRQIGHITPENIKNILEE